MVPHHMESLFLTETSMTLTEIDKQLKENPERLYRIYFFLMEIKKEEARKVKHLQDGNTSGGVDIVKMKEREE